MRLVLLLIWAFYAGFVGIVVCVHLGFVGTLLVLVGTLRVPGGTFCIF